MEELRVKQVQGDDIEMIPGNKDKDYSLPAHEAHMVHVNLKNPQFNRTTGADEGTNIIQKFYVNEFKTMEQNKAFAGVKVILLHYPDLIEAPALKVPAPTPDANAQTTEKKTEVKTQTPEPLKEEKVAAPVVKDYKEMGAKDLVAYREELYADGKSAELGKEDLIKDIEEQLAFLAKEQEGK